MHLYRYLPPEECVPVLLDRARSPVVSLDTEFDSEDPTCRASLHGLSMAGGTPGEGFVGTFWHFGAHETWPWELLRDRVLWPIFEDPERVVTMHPLKVDQQIVRRRGIKGPRVRCAFRCTMTAAHVYNENLPKGLKELAYACLGVTGGKSYKATQREIAGIRKDGEKLVKAILAAAWAYYRSYRATTKTGIPVKARIGGGDVGPELAPELRTGWHAIVDRIPPFGVKKTELTDIVRRRVEPVVMEAHEARALKRFADYGTEDALYTLALDYYFREHTPPELAPILELEVPVCHPLTTEMEENGLRIDLELLGHIKARLEEEAERLRAVVVQEWGEANGIEDFNPNSADQKADVLWNRWGLRPPPWTLRQGRLKPQFVRAKDRLCKADKRVLAYFRDKGGTHAPAIRRMLELSRVEHILSNPVTPIGALASRDPEHRVHSSFWPVGTDSGRYASSDPNVENIPRGGTMPKVPIPTGADPDRPLPGLLLTKKGEWQVASLRDVFIPADGHLFVSSDLSQIENRIVAHESQDATLLGVFRKWDCAACGSSGESREAIHTCPACGSSEGKRDKTHPDQPALYAWECRSCGKKDTAPARVDFCIGCGSRELVGGGFCLGKDIHAHTSCMLGWHESKGFAKGRQDAKAVNHATAYLMTAPTMARQYNLPVQECEKAIEAWHARHPGVRDHLHRKVEEAIRRDGEVTMFTGHKRRCAAYKLLADSGNLDRWKFEECLRMLVNVLAQGGTAALMKRAMLDTRQHILDTPRLRGVRERPNVRLGNQIHDEVLYEAPEDVAEEMLEVVNDHLEHNEYTRLLSVPVIAEGALGETWGRAHG